MRKRGTTIKLPQADVYHQRITVPFEFPVHFTHGLFRPDNGLLASVLDRLGEGRCHRAIVYLDAGVAAAMPTLREQVIEYFHSRPGELELAAPPVVLAGGEAAKNGWATVREVIWTIGNLHLDRQSYVIVIGGGGLLDMVGFAASIVHRGLRLVRVPTTTLAQNDAGVGVKNGMDEHGMKNFLGTFAPPFAVLNDFDFLAALPYGEWISGAAEAFKVAMIKDAAFFDYLCRSAAALGARKAARPGRAHLATAGGGAGRRRATSTPAAVAKAERIMEEIVRRTAILHLEHIRTSGDPFEFGSARPLDFGHWSAHKLETMSRYRLTHGQAVAIGLAMDSYYAMRKGLLPRPAVEKLLRALQACGLPIWDPLLERHRPDGTLDVLEGLAQFREHLGGRLTVTLPRGVGRRVEVHEMDPLTVEEAVQFLRQRALGRPTARGRRR